MIAIWICQIGEEEKNHTILDIVPIHKVQIENDENGFR